MKVLFVSILLVCTLGLKVSQSVDLLQPVELAVQLFSQSLDTTTQSLELQLLTLIYPDTAADVQAQLDVCEDNFWDTEVSSLQSINTDLWNLANACSSEDPTAPVTQLIDDTFAMIAAVAADCDGLTVDLQGDLNKFLAQAIVQSYQMTSPLVGPVEEIIAGLIPPYANPPALQSAIDNGFLSVGVTQEAIDNTEVNAQALIRDWNQIGSEIATTGVPTQADVEDAFSNLWALVVTDVVIWGQAFRSVEQVINPGVQALCSFAGPFMASFSSS